MDSTPGDLLRKSIETKLPDPKRQSAALKDLHLIEAAVTTDRIVVSLDDSARSIFHDVSRDVPEIGGIAWINPDTLGEDGREWLENGAKRRNTFLLSDPGPKPRS